LSAGALPKTPLEELPALLAIFRGPTSKERGDEGENKKEGKRRGKESW